MYESCKEYNCEWCAVIFDKNSNVVLEQWTGADDSTHVPNYEDEEGDHDGEVERFLGSLTGQDLDAFLKVYEGYVEPEDVARESCDVFEGIAGIGDGENPVHNHGPSRGMSVKIYC